ncbi:hypothetical protein HGG75_18660 [Ochrobactrum pseudogrignonense]|nr:hypothetical protein [Brucella pseudogrignonensis]
MARGLIGLGRFISTRIHRVVPRRVANVIGVAVTVVLIWTIANGLLIQSTFEVLDRSFREYDALIEPDRPSLWRLIKQEVLHHCYNGMSLAEQGANLCRRVRRALKYHRSQNARQSTLSAFMRV